MERKINKISLLLNLSLNALLFVGCSPKINTQHFEVSDLITNANEYMKNYPVSDELRGTYHLMAPVGWINDPNGFSEFNGDYHLFYQYNPYSGEWGPMHWGHQKTKDFIKWELVDVALAPDKDYDAGGCFSGTAIVNDNKLYVAYTAAGEFQNQAMAYSYDGVTFKKLDDLLISGKDLPEGFSNSDFRDPKIFYRDSKYYIICGNKAPGSKQIIMFNADNIEGPYSYSGVIYSRNDLSGIFECPDLINIDNKDILIASPQGIKDEEISRYQNNDSCVYLVGNLSTNTNKFYKTCEDLEEFDKGFSFYAPQTLKTSDGRNILVAWMRSWSEPNITKENNWCGEMTLPRELTLVNNHIYQSPVREIESYLTNKVTQDDITLQKDESYLLDSFKGTTSRIKVNLDVSSLTSGRVGVELFKGTSYSTKVYYDISNSYLVIDRTNCGSMYDGVRYCKINPIDGLIKLDMFLDVNSLEVFVNDGYYTMSANIYAPKDCNNVSLYTKDTLGKFVSLEKYDINLGGNN